MVCKYSWVISPETETVTGAYDFEMTMKTITYVISYCWLTQILNIDELINSLAPNTSNSVIVIEHFREACFDTKISFGVKMLEIISNTMIPQSSEKISIESKIVQMFLTASNVNCVYEYFVKHFLFTYLKSLNFETQHYRFNTDCN